MSNAKLEVSSRQLDRRSVPRARRCPVMTGPKKATLVKRLSTLLRVLRKHKCNEKRCRGRGPPTASKTTTYQRRSLQFKVFPGLKVLRFLRELFSLIYVAERHTEEIKWPVREDDGTTNYVPPVYPTVYPTRCQVEEDKENDEPGAST